jgi:hypothetical protein
MEYVGINEECEKWRGTWQDSEFMAKINERQRERDFRDGYMRGFEMAIKVADKKTIKMYLDSLDQDLLQEVIAYAENNKPEVKRVEVIHWLNKNGYTKATFGGSDEIFIVAETKDLQVICIYLGNFIIHFKNNFILIPSNKSRNGTRFV